MKRMLSIRPEFVALILNGLKKIEVRKNAFNEGDEVFIYCTLARPQLYRGERTNQYELCNYPEAWGESRVGNGKVVAKFIVGKCENINFAESGFFYTSSLNSHSLYKKSCLSYGEILEYHASGRFGSCAIEITHLEIFDKPKSLQEFGLKKAPQSWCYVKEGV